MPSDWKLRLENGNRLYTIFTPFISSWSTPVNSPTTVTAETHAQQETSILQICAVVERYVAVATALQPTNNAEDRSSGMQTPQATRTKCSKGDNTANKTHPWYLRRMHVCHHKLLVVLAYAYHTMNRLSILHTYNEFLAVTNTPTSTPVHFAGTPPSSPGTNDASSAAAEASSRRHQPQSHY